MLIKTILKIAVKCSQCGEYKLIDLDLFRLKGRKEFYCECNNKILSTHISKGELIIDVKCITCEILHSYKFKISEVLKQQINIISCPAIGMEIAFLGQESYVQDFVNRSFVDMCELLKSLGITTKRRGKLAKSK